MNMSRLKILVSIGGGPEAYTALEFAALLSRRQCADTHLLTIREPDSGLRSGGMELRVAREQMLGWGLELPGMKRLKRARDIFAELGEIEQNDPEKWEHHSITGDPTGEYVVTYQTPCGGTVNLHLRTGTDVPGLVAGECDREQVSLAIVGAPGEHPSALKRLVSERPLAYRIAARTACPVIIARTLETSHGLLAVLDDSDHSLVQFELLVSMAASCGIPLTLASMAGPGVLETARKSLGRDAESIERTFEVPPDAEAIIQAGRSYSLLAVPAQEGRFRSSLAARVVEGAANSVMVMR